MVFDVYQKALICSKSRYMGVLGSFEQSCTMSRQGLRPALIAACLLLTLLCTVVPPQVIQQNRFRNAFRMLLVYMMLLAAVIPLPNLNIILPIMQRLDPLFLGFDFRGRDVFTSVGNQRHLFWLNTGELPETLEDIVFRLTPVLNRLNWRGGMRRRRQGGKLNNTNKVVLTFLWLRKYPCIDTLALFFDVSRSTVCNIIHSVVPVLWRFFSNEVTWPSIAEWNRMQGEWRFFSWCRGLYRWNASWNLSPLGWAQSSIL